MKTNIKFKKNYTFLNKKLFETLGLNFLNNKKVIFSTLLNSIRNIRLSNPLKHILQYDRCEHNSSESTFVHAG